MSDYPTNRELTWSSSWFADRSIRLRDISLGAAISAAQNLAHWTAAVWQMIIRKGCGLKTAALGFEHLPAIGRTTVSSPFLMKSFEALNAGKSYAEQIKPFNFLLNAHVIPFGHPQGVDPEKFHLITPYDPY